MKNSSTPTQDHAKTRLARILAVVLLGTGSLVIISAMAVFAIHIVVPVAAVLALGILIARGLLHSSSDSSESIGQDLVRFSKETVVEGAHVVGQLRRSAAPQPPDLPGVRESSPSDVAPSSHQHAED